MGSESPVVAVAASKGVVFIVSLVFVIEISPFLREFVKDGWWQKVEIEIKILRPVVKAEVKRALAFALNLAVIEGCGLTVLLVVQIVDGAYGKHIGVNALETVIVMGHVAVVAKTLYSG